MKAALKKIFILLVIVVLTYHIYGITRLYIYYRHTNMWHLQQKILEKDYRTILVACQSLIPDGNENIPDELRVLEEKNANIRIYPNYYNFSSIIPEAIRVLDIQHITITQDYALVKLKFPGRRIALLAFKKDSEVFGTRELCDGLWYWNGDRYGDNPPLTRQLVKTYGFP